MNCKFSSFCDFFSSGENYLELLKGNWGLEKESLRIDQKGDLSLSPHLKSFGSKLTNPFITTDFSESQLELITPKLKNIEDTIEFLKQIHIYVAKNLGNEELLWPFSMPARLPNEEEIPIAKYGNSKEAKLKEIYRKGIALRYGKRMQMICGIHYNYSFSENFFDLLASFLEVEKSQKLKNYIYFKIARNFLRFRWFVVFLFGSSSMVDLSFEKEVISEIEEIKSSCVNTEIPSLFKNFATSFRMSRYGYSNTRQRGFVVSYNNIEAYISDIRKALNTKSKKYEKIGIFKDKEQVQLNENVLQIPSEYYSSIRFKQNAKKDENLLDSLEKRGVNHIELRVFDLDPFLPLGIDEDMMRFIQVFLLLCLFEQDFYIGKKERECIDRNKKTVALLGRNKDIKLNKCFKEEILLKDWAREILEKMLRISKILDKGSRNNIFTRCVEKQTEKTKDYSLLPSQKIIKEMRRYNNDFIRFGTEIAKRNLDKYKNMEVNQEIQSKIKEILR